MSAKTIYSIDGINAYPAFPGLNEAIAYNDQFRHFTSSEVKEIAIPYLKVEVLQSERDNMPSGIINVYLYLIP